MEEKRAPTRGYGLLEGFLAKKRYLMAEKLIPTNTNNKKILDIGCGEHPMFLINSQFSHKYGLDKLITESKKRHLEAQNIILDNYDFDSGGRIPFDDRFFYAIFMLAVFEHFEPSSLIHIMSEVYRVLEPGGMLVLTTPASWTAFILSSMSKLRLVSPHEIDEHKDSYSPARIRSILEQSGFADEKIKTGYFELCMNIWVRAAK